MAVMKLCATLVRRQGLAMQPLNSIAAVVCASRMPRSATAGRIARMARMSRPESVASTSAPRRMAAVCTSVWIWRWVTAASATMAINWAPINTHVWTSMNVRLLAFAPRCASTRSEPLSASARRATWDSWRITPGVRPAKDMPRYFWPGAMTSGR